jgi:hypothetical protein
MYPRNAETPPVIDLGEIVLKFDGTQQTTGVSVRVRIGTGAWGAGAGTLACDATSGIWTYAPTQAETNADYFVIGAYKASCTSVSKTVITSNSATSGTVLLAPVTHTSAVLPTVSTLTGHTPQTGDSFARIGATGSGLTSLAPSVTALSTATWTNTLATNLATTNSAVATNLDATISSRLASVSYSAPPSAVTISAQVAADLLTAHGSGSWTTATGFATPANVTDAVSAIRGANGDTLETLSDQIDGIESGGLTSEQAAALTRIDTKTALITGSKLSVAGAVTPGGDITLVIGDDRASDADSELLRSITDTGGALHTRLAAASQVTFGAGRNGVPDLITGTVTSSYSANVTTLTIEIDQAGVSTDAIASEDYTYQIQRVTADGDHVIEVSGNLTLLDRYAARTQ